MAGASLLTLIDDISVLMDDVAVMSKVAVKKTAGVLGDDLAVNAEQVSGVATERELPVVWAVAKGSLLNKVILVPAALLISLFIPWLITPLLTLGGAFLCFEGFEKIHHWWTHRGQKESHTEQQDVVSMTAEEFVDLERQKIKGAIRTDFILSAEIVVIALGTMMAQSLTMQAVSLSLVAVLVTAGVYGLVAIIVKLDDAGLWLINNNPNKSYLRQKLGLGLLSFAPWLMKALAVVGTIAMFLVGGGIISHAIPWLEHLSAAQADTFNHIPSLDLFWESIGASMIHLISGAVLGAVCFGMHHVYTKIKGTA
jgi:predicted DNA repair protein MutK